MLPQPQKATAGTHEAAASQLLDYQRLPLSNIGAVTQASPPTNNYLIINVLNGESFKPDRF